MTGANTVLGTEINRVLESNSRDGNEVTFTALLHTGNDDLVIDYINNITVTRDFNNNFTDIVFIEFMFPKGDFIYDVYPYRNNLDLTLFKKRFNKVESSKYKIVLKGDFGSIMGGQDSFKPKDTLNKESVMLVKGQCLQIEIEALRNKTVSGVYNDKNVHSVIASAFIKAKNDLLVFGQKMDFNLNIVGPNNERVYDHIIVNPGVCVLDLPSYLQNTAYGVYNGNIGTYFTRFKNVEEYDAFVASNGESDYSKEDNVFIYPLYNPELTCKESHKLLIYQTSSFKYSFSDSTYLLEGDDIKIVAGLDSGVVNAGEESLMNDGTGYDIHDPNTLLNKGTYLTEDGVYTTPEKTQKAAILKERADGVNKTTVVNATDNRYKVRSDFLRNNGSYIKIKWNFSNEDHLYPAMPVLYTFVNSDNVITTLKGVLHHVLTFYNVNAQTSVSMLGIFVERDTNVKE